MEIVLREYQMLAIIIAVIIGYQISIYFFYQYYNLKEDKLDLNKILIAYGFLYSFGLTGIVVRTIDTYYVEDPLFSNLLSDLTLIFIFLGTIGKAINCECECSKEAPAFKP